MLNTTSKAGFGPLSTCYAFKYDSSYLDPIERYQNWFSLSTFDPYWSVNDDLEDYY